MAIKERFGSIEVAQMYVDEKKSQKKELKVS